jgi:hypothetical protein
MGELVPLLFQRRFSARGSANANAEVKSQKSKVKSQKAYRADFLAVWNGCPIYAVLY